MALIIGTVKAQFFNNDGTFADGGKVYSYITGGAETPKATYPTVADALAGTNANSNPIILDQRGEANIVLQGATRLVLKDALDNQIWSVDHLNATTSNVVDSAGNPMLSFVEVLNAVNGVTITNAATGGKPILGFTGGDINVGGIIQVKGTANLNIIAAILALTGNQTISGTLGVTGASTLTGAVAAQSTLNVTGATTMAALTASGAVNFVPTGVILPYAGTSAPSGFLGCDGTAVSRTTYAGLFAAIGTTWGVGDGSTTFNLPNLNRKALVGSGGSGTATLANSVGSTCTAETVTISTANLPVNVPVGNSGTPANASFALGADRQCPNYNGGAWSGGSGTATNIMQPSAVVLMIIRAI